MLVDALRVVQVALYAAAVPLALVAARGYADAPFGTVVAPLAPLAAAFVALAGVELVAAGPVVADLRLLLGLAALALFAWFAVRAVSLLGEAETV